MIDPRDFINNKEKVTPTIQNDEDIEVSGSFICGECLANVGIAYLNQDDMILSYICIDGHKNTATL